MAWLSGWAKRIELTSDHTKVDSALTHFAITAFLKAGNGDTVKVFEAGGVGASYLKTAVADDDGRQFYVEVEQWDSTAKVGVIHFGRTGSAYDLPSASAKKYYLYYDAAHADNTTYVGVTQSDAAKNVWDSNFKFRSDKKDKTTSTMEDSTSGAHHLTKEAANKPIQVDGKVGKAQDYDGSTHYARCTDTDIVANEVTNATIEVWARVDAAPGVGENRELLALVTSPSGSTGFLGVLRYHNNAGTYELRGYFGATAGTWATNAYTMTVGTWYHLALVKAGTTVTVYVNGVALTNTGTQGTALDWTTTSTGLTTGGSRHTPPLTGDFDIYTWNGALDEFRVSETNHTVSWLKATYNSLNDSLLTYGSEETCIPFRSIYPHILIR